MFRSEPPANSLAHVRRCDTLERALKWYLESFVVVCCPCACVCALLEHLAMVHHGDNPLQNGHPHDVPISLGACLNLKTL